LTVTGGNFYRSYDGISTGWTSTSYPATVSSFRLDKYEVTVGRFRQFVTAWVGGFRPSAGAGKHSHLNGGNGLAATGGGFEPGWSTSWATNLATSASGWDTNLMQSATLQTWTSSVGANEKLPIDYVSWYEAYAFCIWDGGFLPSEAEWNYAAAGGSEQRAYPWSSAYPPGDATIDCSYANYNDGSVYCSTSSSTSYRVLAVGADSPKGDGKYGQTDLAGNLWEWNLDWVAAYTTPCVDCVDATSAAYRVYRGGSCSPTAAFLLASYRGSNILPTGRSSIGIRCARTP
jgi:formylglycine-generating enzyme required for sulfatase activity